MAELVGGDCRAPGAAADTRLRRLFGEAWVRARRRRRQLFAFGIVAGVAAAGGLVAGSGGGGRGSTQAPTPRSLPLVLRLTPSLVGRHDRIVVSITTAAATGVVGDITRSYVAESRAVHSGVGCVNNRNGYFPGSLAGSRTRAVLDPANGDGGPNGWCSGVYQGLVVYTRAFDCRSIRGACHPPPGFASRTAVVARFVYRVR